VQPPGAPAGDVFVGRSDELVQLASALDSVRSGNGRAVLVTGDAGVGKTRLVQRAAALADGFLVLTGACLPLSSLSVPLLPLRSGLTAVAAEERPALDGTGQGAAEEFDRWLELACAQKPVALVVDDLHWADPATLDVLMWIIAGLPSRRLAVVATVRRGEVGPGHPLQRWTADVRRLPGFTQLSLAPLDLEETREQVAGVLGDVPHDSLVHEVFDRTGGNAYLNKLLVTGLPATATGLGDGALPDDLSAAVLRAWHLLSPPARELSRVIAIGGRVARGAALSHASALAGVDDPGPLLRECVEAGVFDVHDGDGCWFHHPLQAEALEASLAAPERHRLHAAFAALLEADLDGTTPDLATVILVADHHHRADNAEAALNWSLWAADTAEADGAYAEAVTLLHRAIAVKSAHTDEDGSLSRLWSRMSEAAARAGDLVEELAAVQALLAGGHLDAMDTAELVVRRQHLRFSTGAGFLDLAEMDRAVDLSAGAPRSWQHAFALAEAAHAALWADDPRAADLAHQALQRARDSGHPRALAHALAASSMSAIFDGREAEALELASEGVEAAARARDGWAFVHACLWEANALEFHAAEQYFETLHRRRLQLTSLGAPHPFVAWLAVVEAFSQLHHGEWEVARQRLREALGSTPGVFVDVMGRLTAAELAARQGRSHEATGHLTRADELFAETSTFLAFQFDACRAIVRHAAGDPRGCVTAALAGTVTPGVPPTMCEWLLPLAARGLADLAQTGRDAGADVHDLVAEADDLESRFPHIIRDAALGHGYEAIVEALDALYQAELGRVRAAAGLAEAWCRAAGLMHGSLPWEECYARWRAAESLFNEGRSQRTSAVAALRDAHALAQRLGATPDLAQIETMARGARIPLGAPTAHPSGMPSPTAPTAMALTPREAEILGHIVAGRTYGEIARALVVSEKTVSSHVSHLLSKTGCANRIDLARWAGRDSPG
jgi:DNA-binding CsgD family transcriptional regulator/tetratricopeptide (TPR) repeat protein